ENAADTSYVCAATLSHAAGTDVTITTDKGIITIADGQTTGTLVIASGNGEDVYKDASSLTANITGTSGGNFENLVVGTGTATANVTDTVTNATVSLSASTVAEGAGANYVFTATLSSASQGVTTITTDKGIITIADGQTTGTLVIASGNGEDVYNDATSLSATITATAGGNFENLTIGTASATAHVNDTITAATVDLSASTVLENAADTSYVFTAT
uniref:immunoglobulin-like domain-containing protein n=1 Tax=Mesorhizobium norvegicum TaxID=1085774 RepID=UPI001AEE097A